MVFEARYTTYTFVELEKKSPALPYWPYRRHTFSYLKGSRHTAHVSGQCKTTASIQAIGKQSEELYNVLIRIDLKKCPIFFHIDFFLYPTKAGFSSTHTAQTLAGIVVNRHHKNAPLNQTYTPKSKSQSINDLLQLQCNVKNYFLTMNAFLLFFNNYSYICSIYLTHLRYVKNKKLRF